MADAPVLSSLFWSSLALILRKIFRTESNARRILGGYTLGEIKQGRQDPATCNDKITRGDV